MGRYVLAEDYVRALRGREILRDEVDRVLAGLDALALPTLAIPAPSLGRSTVVVDGADVAVRTIMLRLTQLFNVTGHPAVSLPCGTTPDGLPVGLQLVGRRGATRGLLLTATSLEAEAFPRS
jgi:aspartyl-tRNA(Asn)/glutamyl-tRNA(Gln) amidotransferase subunit A